MDILLEDLSAQLEKACIYQAECLSQIEYNANNKNKRMLLVKSLAACDSVRAQLNSMAERR